jgi:hypothetical protein
MLYETSLTLRTGFEPTAIGSTLTVWNIGNLPPEVANSVTAGVLDRAANAPVVLSTENVPLRSLFDVSVELKKGRLVDVSERENEVILLELMVPDATAESGATMVMVRAPPP